MSATPGAIAVEILANLRGLITSLDIQIVLDEDHQRPRCEMVIGDAHLGKPGVAHGGTVMSLLDTALGAEAMTHAISQGMATSTVEMKVNLLRPALQGKKLVTSTHLQYAGRSLMVVHGSVREADTEKEVAFAVGTFNLYESPRFREHTERLAEALSTGI